MVKYSQYDPLEEYECDRGGVSNDKRSSIYITLDEKLGEFVDVYCVSKNKKKLAALDFSTYGKNKLRKRNKSLINKIIEYSNYKKVKALHNKKRGGMYLNTVFFTQRNYKNALRLMDILWNPVLYFKNSIDEQIAIGLLLDYDKKNIIFFIEKTFDIKIDKKEVTMLFKNIKTKINKMKVSLEDLNKHSNIVLLDTIETI